VSFLTITACDEKGKVEAKGMIAKVLPTLAGRTKENRVYVNVYKN